MIKITGWMLCFLQAALFAAGAVERALRHSFQERLLRWKEKASKEPPPPALDEGNHWGFELDLKRALGGPSAAADSLQRIAMGTVVRLKFESDPGL